MIVNQFACLHKGHLQHVHLIFHAIIIWYTSIIICFLWKSVEMYLVLLPSMQLAY